VISNMTFASVGAAADPQAGAVRWYPSSGVVHQVYVSEEWRRHRLGTALLYTADAFHHANGWPGALRSDGRRTDIGERFVAGLRHPHRIRPRDTVMPPMDAE
jgi:GNAT superfamily N-acetyltransferase